MALSALLRQKQKRAALRFKQTPLVRALRDYALSEIFPERMHPKIRCRAAYISDLHLGTPSCCASAVLQFLEQVEPEILFLVGDIFDCWKMNGFDLCEILKDPLQKAVWEKLKEFGERGVKNVFVTGNHDDYFRKGHADELPIKNLSIVSEFAHVAADGKRVLVIHGDQFDEMTYKYFRISVLITRAYEALVKIGVGADRIVHALGLSSRGAGSLTRVLHTMRVVQNKMANGEHIEGGAFAYVQHKNAEIIAQNEMLPQAMHLKPYDAIVCGHTHVALTMQAPSLRDETGRHLGPEKIAYWNAGSWTGPSCSANKDAKHKSQRHHEMDKFPAYNTAVIEHEDGKMEQVWLDPVLGVLPLKTDRNGFHAPALKEPRACIYPLPQELPFPESPLCPT